MVWDDPGNAWRGSLGLEPTIELYIKHMVEIFREVRRVLRKDGILWLNMGDSYASGGRGYNEHMDNFLGKGTGKAQALGPKKAPLGLKEKDLCGIPWRVAFALQADGWWLRSAMPWVKRSAMPESCTDRPASALEYVFLLTKSGTSQYWTHRDMAGTRTKPKADWRWVSQIDQAELSESPPDWKEKIKCPNCNGKGEALVDISYEFMGKWVEQWVEDECPVCEGKKRIQKWKRINLWQGRDYYFDMDAVRVKSTGQSGLAANFARETKDHIIPKQSQTQHRRNRKDTQDTGSRNFRNTDLFYQSIKPPHGMIFAGDEMVGLDTNPQAYKKAHFATFPEKLIEPCILAGTSAKGCCPECLAPWVRVVESKYVMPETRKSNPNIDRSRYENQDKINIGYRPDQVFSKKSKTIGWQPTCSHTHFLVPCEPIPCTVLDPFGGSGTTAIVSEKHGRKWALIELQPDYVNMSRQRIKKKTKQMRMF